MLDRATQLLCCSVCEGGCGTRPFARCAGNGALQSSPSRRCAAGNPRSAALLGADHSRPDLPAPGLAGKGGVCSKVRKAPPLLGPEGGVPSGRMGAGEQRSAERVCPAVPRRVGEKALCSGPFRADAESSQPPSRSEQRSAPSPQARAATAKPRRDTTLGPRATRARADLRSVRKGPSADLRSNPRLERCRSSEARWSDSNRFAPNPSAGLGTGLSKPCRPGVRGPFDMESSPGSVPCPRRTQ
jgi:hypothetical protein